MSINTAISVVDYLTSVKKPSDFQSRLKLAQSYGIQNYAGSAEQNTQLLGFLKAPTPPAPAPAPGGGAPAPGTPGGADPAMVIPGPSGGGDPAKPPTAAPTPAPAAPGGPLVPAAPPMEGARLLGPSEYEALRKQNQVGDANFGQFFVKDQAGNIFLRPDAPKGPAAAGDAPAGGAGTGPKTDIVPAPDKPLGDRVDDIMKRYGIQPPGADQDPLTSFSDVYKQLYENMGLTTIKTQYDDLTKSYQAIQDELSGKIADVNENPWITEGQRQDKVNSLNARYEAKTANLTNRMTLLEKMFDQGRQQAEFVATTALQEKYRGQSLRQDLVLKAIDLAESRTDSERRLAADERLQAERLAADKKLQDDRIAADKAKAATPDIAEYEYAKANSGYKGTFAQWQKEQANLKARSAGGGRALTEREKVQGFLETAGTALAASRGKDGFVNTKTYGTKYQEYLFRGGSPKEFFNIFPPDQYLNPQDPTAKFYRDKADSEGLGSLAS